MAGLILAFHPENSSCIMGITTVVETTSRDM